MALDVGERYIYIYIWASQNLGYHVGGPHNKDYSILGSILGPLFCGTPISTYIYIYRYRERMCVYIYIYIHMEAQGRCFFRVYIDR